jgi:predicted TIM-barrel fold metal-dependent hydrolase
MKYFDFHQHYGLLSYRGTNIDSLKKKPDDLFEELVIEKCRKLDMVVAINGAGLLPGFHLVNRNDEVERFFTKYPAEIIGIGFVDLDYDTPAVVDDLYKRGFKGIKTIWPSKRYDSPEYFPLYERCQYYGLPILFHTGICAQEGFNGKEGACSYNMEPIFLEGIALRFHGLQLVGAHLGTGSYQTACFIAQSSTYAHNNIRFDISAADLGRRMIQQGNYIKNLIPVESVLWGCDEPPTRYEELIHEWNEYFEVIGLTDREKECIFYRNACSLLGIPL